MSETITIEHEDDPGLWVTLRAPTREQYAETWNDIVRAAIANMSPDEAYRNLVIECRDEPSPSELSKVLEEWPGLPEAAWPHLLTMAGNISFMKLKDVRKLPPERAAEMMRELGSHVVDLRALASASSEYYGSPPAETDAERAQKEAYKDLWGTDVTAMLAEGVTLETVADWCSRYSRAGALFAILTPHGFFAFHRPGSTAYMAYQVMSRRDSYQACERLVSACALHPKPGALGPILEEHPALVPIFANELREMAGEGAAIVKKGSRNSAPHRETPSSALSA